MGLTIRQVDVDEWHDVIHDLDRETFPGDMPVDLEGAEWWIAFDDGAPVAFAGAVLYEDENAVYLRRAGVVPQARGRGIQRRLIRARKAWAARMGANIVYTYTVQYNNPSANNLISCGFRLYDPPDKWGGSSSLYWQSRL